MNSLGDGRGDTIGTPAEPLRRLIAHLRAETDALRCFVQVDLERGIQIKSQALLELTRHARTLAGTRPDPALREALTQLRSGLADNQAALTLHLDAARKVSAIVVGAMEREHSDLTYSAAPARTRARA